MSWTYNIDQSVPPDTGRSPRLGAQDIRNFKKAVCERLGDWIYGMLADDSEADETKYGVKTLPLNEQSSDPTSASDRGFVYAKDVSGVTELFYEDSSGNVKQLTSGGKLNIEATEAVLLTGDQIIEGIKRFSSFPVTPSSAPSDDYEVANKKYVDDQTSANKVALGAWEAKSPNTVYQATSDGFVIAFGGGSPASGVYLRGYTDSSNPPATKRAESGMSPTSGSGNVFMNLCMPVKSGDYWKVEGENNTPTVYWIPLS